MTSSIIKIDLFKNAFYMDGVWKFKDTNLPLNGIYEDEDEDETIRHFKNGKLHNENGPAFIEKNGYKIYLINDKRHRIDGPAVIYPDGFCEWWINDFVIYKGIMNNWLKENNIPRDWNTWTDSDKMKFALHWSDYNG